MDFLNSEETHTQFLQLGFAKKITRSTIVEESDGENKTTTRTDVVGFSKLIESKQEALNLLQEITSRFPRLLFEETLVKASSMLECASNEESDAGLESGFYFEISPLPIKQSNGGQKYNFISTRTCKMTFSFTW